MHTIRAAVPSRQHLSNSQLDLFVIRLVSKRGLAETEEIKTGGLWNHAG